MRDLSISYKLCVLSETFFYKPAKDARVNGKIDEQNVQTTRTCLANCTHIDTKLASAFFRVHLLFFLQSTLSYFMIFTRLQQREKKTLTYAENVSTFYIINIMYDVCIKILFSLCIIDGVYAIVDA